MDQHWIENPKRLDRYQHIPPIILRSESIVTTLEGDLLDSLHQSNLLIIYNVVLVHAVEPRIVTPKNQVRILEIAPNSKGNELCLDSCCVYSDCTEHLKQNIRLMVIKLSSVVNVLKKRNSKINNVLLGRFVVSNHNLFTIQRERQ